MRLDDDYDSYAGSRFKTTAVGIGVAIVIAILVLMLILNRDNVESSSTSIENQTISETVSANDETNQISSNLTPGDLDFFEMYPKESQIPDENNTAVPLTKEEMEEYDPSADGNHTLLKYSDGTEEWVELSKYIRLNEYDYTKLQNQDGYMEYVEKGRTTSYLGISVSEDQGYIDFNKVYNAGIDYVMVCAGGRDFVTGKILIDSYFADNLKRATDAGLLVGAYFTSQAISEAEAEEEAAEILKILVDYKIDYPIAYVMTYGENENSRVETLTRSEKTMISRAFLKKIYAEGFNPILYGDKVWLIKYLDLAKIVSDFNVWIYETEDYPTYPYRFTMWQYSDKGTVPGIKGDVSMSISFIDYSLE